MSSRHDSRVGTHGTHEPACVLVRAAGAASPGTHDTHGAIARARTYQKRVPASGSVTQSFGESPPELRATPPNEGGYSDTQRLSLAERALLADLATEYGAGPFTSARAAALLARHVRGVGTFLGRAARSGELIAAPTGSVRLVRARTVQGRLSLWCFEIVEATPARDPDEDVL